MRAIRRRRHLSQVEFARRLDMRPGPVSNIERGHNLPSAPVLCNMAEVLDVPVDAFFESGGGAKMMSGEAAGGPGGYVAAAADDSLGPAAELVRSGSERAEIADETLRKLGRLTDSVLALEDLAGARKSATVPLRLPFVFSVEGLRELAGSVRRILGVSEAVIFDYLELLENAGLRIIFCTLEEDGGQSFSCYDAANANAVIFIHSELNAERQLFLLLYELGRIYCFTRLRDLKTPCQADEVVDRRGKPLNEHRAARFFAGQFLMPASAVRNSVHQLAIKPQEWTYTLLLRLKHRFGVSAESFLYRLGELELIRPELERDIKHRIELHYRETDYSEPDSSQRILTPNGRLGDLLVRAKERCPGAEEISVIERTFKSLGVTC
ncbi:putative transcriptional regulator [Kiritimatiella glycovorans]|uniref:Putative transcriptional regulator n=1 Tax=Kiritimatiella glycovorans TaxID=1307763 RepID=A0A0G3EMI4_9BACT|nr:putative transcriptional regulator [Kiritimatiella glycovorans]